MVEQFSGNLNTINFVFTQPVASLVLGLCTFCTSDPHSVSVCRVLQTMIALYNPFFCPRHAKPNFFCYENVHIYGRDVQHSLSILSMLTCFKTPTASAPIIARAAFQVDIFLPGGTEKERWRTEDYEGGGIGWENEKKGRGRGIVPDKKKVV